jgi:hypothetical protein
LSKNSGQHKFCSDPELIGRDSRKLEMYLAVEAEEALEFTPAAIRINQMRKNV